MKPIRITNAQKEAIIRDFVHFINTERLSDNRIQYSITLQNIISKDVKKPTVHITANAYLKMLALMCNYTTEVGWHGCVTRDVQKQLYTITDIHVYPQTVSGVNVTTDDKEYAEWLIKELDDETFNTLRFHGHSHVHMSTGPSPTDQQMYSAILQTLQQGDYYIFAIMNKSLDLNIWIYDFNQEIIFEKNDITLKILAPDGTELTKWVKEQDKNVTTYRTQSVYNSSHIGQLPYYYDDYSIERDLPPTTSYYKKRGKKHGSK